LSRFRGRKQSARKLVQGGRVFATKPKSLWPFNPTFHQVNQYGPLASINPFPNRKLAVLRYTDAPVISLACGTAGTGGSDRDYALNSLFSPLVGGGHQPYMYDQIVGAGYQHYRVNAVSIKVTAFGPSATSTVLGFELQAWSAAAGSLNGVTWEYHNERPNAWTIAPVAPLGREVITLEKIPIAQIEGLTRQEYRSNVEDYAALVTASPARTPYLRIACFDQSGNTGAVISLTVELIFYAEFWDLQQVPHS